MVVQPFFASKAVGDTFDGVIAVSNPLVYIGDTVGNAVFDLESIHIDGFDPIFFSDPRILLGGGGFSLEGSEPFSEPTLFFIGGLITEPFASDFNLANPTPEFLAVSLLQNDSSRFLVDRTIGGLRTIDRLEFDVTSASISPDATVIPLPAAGWLMIAGLGGLVAVRHRKTIS